MAKATTNKQHIITHPKGTSIGDGHLKLSSMNKKKKANFKRYRGQGR